MFLSQGRELKKKRHTDEDDLALQSRDTTHPLSVPPSLLPKMHPITEQRAQRLRSSSPEKGKPGPLHPQIFPCSLHSVEH